MTLGKDSGQGNTPKDFMKASYNFISLAPSVYFILFHIAAPEGNFLGVIVAVVEGKSFSIKAAMR